MSYQSGSLNTAIAGMFKVTATVLQGCIELMTRRHDDARGRFVKVFHREAFSAYGLDVDYAEDYYSVSRRDVIRGLHFQAPPLDHAKLVYCVSGQVQDIALDLRLGSPTYGQHAVIELSADAGNMVYLPRGIAHGFCVRSETATLIYKASTPHSADHDMGILWNSAGISWAAASPILSPRDRCHPPLAGFASPFRYEGTP